MRSIHLSNPTNRSNENFRLASAEIMLRDQTPDRCRNFSPARLRRLNLIGIISRFIAHQSQIDQRYRKWNRRVEPDGS
jgi:hypothetical protein